MPCCGRSDKSALLERALKLRERLARIPFSYFKAGDLGNLLRLYDLDHLHYRIQDEKVIERFEKIADRFERRNSRKG